MTQTSSNLCFPFLAPAQAQKHVTVNESLLRLDALVQLSAASATTSVQPVAPAGGAVYILPAGKTGAAWSGMANGALAYWRDGAWEQIVPRDGWLAFVRDTGTWATYRSGAWGVEKTRQALQLDTAGLVDVENLWMAQQSFSQSLKLLGGGESYELRRQGADGYFELVATQATFNGFRYIGAGTTLFDISSVGAAQFSGPAMPKLDNTVPCGWPTARWSTIYAATGVINTSDAREKTEIAPCPLGLDFVRALRPVAFRRVEGRRTHTGFIAQEVRAATPSDFDWAAWTMANPADADSLQGLRHDQLLAPLVRAVQELAARIDGLDADAAAGRGRG
jgi:hypothetical protein